MKGKYNIFVQNNRLRYDFVISRNITIIRGDSATGKTTLLELLEAYDRDGDSSGVLVKCDVPCVVIGGNRWAENLQFIHGFLLQNVIELCRSIFKSCYFCHLGFVNSSIGNK